MPVWQLDMRNLGLHLTCGETHENPPSLCVGYCCGCYLQAQSVLGVLLPLIQQVGFVDDDDRVASKLPRCPQTVPQLGIVTANKAVQHMIDTQITCQVHALQLLASKCAHLRNWQRNCMLGWGAGLNSAGVCCTGAFLIFCTDSINLCTASLTLFAPGIAFSASPCRILWNRQYRGTQG